MTAGFARAIVMRRDLQTKRVSLGDLLSNRGVLN